MESNQLKNILDGIEKPTNLSFALLKNITQHFSEKREIGQGGFATVYKGVLPNGNVAVKRIMNSHTIDEKLFYSEVDSLLKVNHENIVRFLGFCASTEQTVVKIEGVEGHVYAEIRERLICFEYITNGSVQKHITDELRGLEWDTRYQIIEGICNGLHYLHTEKNIIHMDLKPANILLSNNMVPKITDFGLSRLAEISQTMSANRYATLGYCDPEYLHRGKMSFKSDMYSLGVIIIEPVTGRKDITDVGTVLRRWRHRWNNSVKDTRLGCTQVTKCIEIGLLCQEKVPFKRPSICDVINYLNVMEGDNGKVSNANESTLVHANESTFGHANESPRDHQIIPYPGDDMLGIEPLEVHFPFEHNRQISSSFQLTNDTDACIAFKVQKMSLLPYCLLPNKGIVLPRSKCSVDITLQPQEKVPKHADEFIVRSTRVTDGFEAENITSDMFEENMANLVDEVNLDVVFDAQLQSELLDIRPLKLCFPVEPNKLIPCSLHLTNNKDKQVVFRLMEMEKSYNRECLLKLPLYNIVPPRSTYTLVVTLSTEKMENLPKQREVDLILETVTSDEYITSFKQSDYCDQYFEKAKRENVVHMVSLKAIYAPQRKDAF